MTGAIRLVVAPRAFWLTMAAAFAAWTVWCALIVFVGAPFGAPLVRAFARIAAVAVPAILLLRSHGPDRFRLAGNVRRGVMAGVFAAAVGLAVVAVSWWGAVPAFALPTSAAIWVSVILFSPMAEELLFRRVAYGYLATRCRPLVALAVRSLLFALIHLPWWLLSGEFGANALLGGLATMFGAGVVFALLYRWTGSLWSCVILHCANNFLAECIRAAA